MKNIVIIYGLSAIAFIVAFGLFVFIQVLLEKTMHIKLGSILMCVGIFIVFSITGWVYKKLKSRYEKEDEISPMSSKK